MNQNNDTSQWTEKCNRLPQWWFNAIIFYSLAANARAKKRITFAIQMILNNCATYQLPSMLSANEQRKAHESARNVADWIARARQYVRVSVWNVKGANCRSKAFQFHLKQYKNPTVPCAQKKDREKRFSLSLTFYKTMCDMITKQCRTFDARSYRYTYTNINTVDGLLNCQLTTEAA